MTRPYSLQIVYFLVVVLVSIQCSPVDASEPQFEVVARSNQLAPPSADSREPTELEKARQEARDPRTVSDLDNPQAFEHLRQIADILETNHKPEEALPLRERDLAASETLFREDNSLVVLPLLLLAKTYSQMGDDDKALTLGFRALKIAETSSRKDAANGIIASLEMIGKIYVSRGEYTNAISPFERSLELSESVNGPLNATTATARNEIAVVQLNLGWTVLALPNFHMVLPVFEQTFGENSSQVAVVLTNIGLTLSGYGRYDNALPYLQRALAINETLFGVSSPECAKVMR